MLFLDYDNVCFKLNNYRKRPDYQQCGTAKKLSKMRSCQKKS